MGKAWSNPSPSLNIAANGLEVPKNRSNISFALCGLKWKLAPVKNKEINAISDCKIIIIIKKTNIVPPGPPWVPFFSPSSPYWS